ncbi:MAG: hypothetical protein HKN94_04655 [Acidimicrobiales bacterium]|nr:hypothetical protein [Acidimicrobiales bacterium]
MNVEQRLLQAFEQVDRVEPSADLWSRVVHSIDEDRRHRARLLRSMGTLATALAGFVAVVILSIEDGSGGRFVRWEALEVIETIALVTIIVVLGPAIRRFGRGYADDLFAGDTTFASALLRLLDIAYWLISAGFILATVRFGERDTDRLAVQLTETSERIAGMVMVLGLLHAVALVVLPLVAFVHNSSQRDRPLPRWVVVLLLLLGLGLLTQLPGVIGVLVLLGSGG